MLLVNARWPISTRFTMKIRYPIALKDLGVRLLEIRLLRSKIANALPACGNRSSILIYGFSKSKGAVPKFGGIEVEPLVFWLPNIYPFNRVNENNLYETQRTQPVVHFLVWRRWFSRCRRIRAVRDGQQSLFLSNAIRCTRLCSILQATSMVFQIWSTFHWRRCPIISCLSGHACGGVGAAVGSPSTFF